MLSLDEIKSILSNKESVSIFLLGFIIGLSARTPLEIFLKSFFNKQNKPKDESETNINEKNHESTDCSSAKKIRSIITCNLCRSILNYIKIDYYYKNEKLPCAADAYHFKCSKCNTPVVFSRSQFNEMTKRFNQ